MDRTFTVTPLPYGAVHFLILGGILLLSVAFAFAIRKASPKKLLRLLFVFGVGMLLAEVWKQWFAAKYVYAGVRSMWFFPWQLCSMAMYLCVLVPFLKGKAQETVLVFLASFSLLAAVFALVFPGDMLRPQILLFCHSFIYHAIMVVDSLAAVLILSRRKKAKFLPAAILFLLMSAVAEVINVVSYNLFPERGRASNMFNITPYWPSTQPVFHDIAVKLGVVPEIIIYTAVIALASWGLFMLVNLIAGKYRKNPENRA
jgi:uncharacterized membrane protein YwaF